MTDEERYLASRLSELSKRSFSRGIWTFSGFLTLAEQALVHGSAESDYMLYGGYEAAERRIAVFGSIDLCGYQCEMPIKVVEIRPTSQKFADALSHRDFLGSLMSIGIKREVLGDIVVRDNVGYVICLDSIAEFVSDNIVQVKHTTVHCEILNELPDGALSEPVLKEVLVASERIDALISAVFNLSRSDSKELFDEKKIFIDSKGVNSASIIPKDGSIISVRGKGRFRYNGVVRYTKKGKMSVSVEVY